MKKLGTAALLTAAALTMGSVSTGSRAATLAEIRKQGVVRIAVANEIPYGYMDLQNRAKGAGPDVAKELMQRLGIKKIEWITTSFGSLIPGLRANRFDMVAAEMAILPQRCKGVLFSEPNSSYGEGLLVPKGNPQNLHSFEQFAKGKEKIAIMAGADQLDMLQALGISQDQMVNIPSNANAISTVSTGRASAYAATGVTIRQLASKSAKVEAAQGFIDPIIDGEPVRSWGAFTFANGSEDFRAAVNAELTKFKKTEKWSKILTQYGFTEADIKHSFDKSTDQLCSG